MIFGSPPIVTNGLVLNLDAANTKSYPRSGTTWNDLSGNNYSGSLVNGPTFNPANGGSIVFDGTNDYVNSPLVISSRPFSLSCWVIFNSTAGWQTFIGQDTSQSTQPGSIYLQKTNDITSITPRVNNTFGISMLNTSNAQIDCYDTTFFASSSIWYNIVTSVSLSEINLYRNGILVKTVSNSDTLAAPTGSVKIGAGIYNRTITDYVKGNISNVQLYNRALSPSEIQQNYNAVKSRFNL